MEEYADRSDVFSVDDGTVGGDDDGPEFVPAAAAWAAGAAKAVSGTATTGRLATMITAPKRTEIRRDEPSRDAYMECPFVISGRLNDRPQWDCKHPK